MCISFFSAIVFLLVAKGTNFNIRYIFSSPLLVYTETCTFFHQKKHEMINRINPHFCKFKYKFYKYNFIAYLNGHVAITNLHESTINLYFT